MKLVRCSLVVATLVLACTALPLPAIQEPTCPKICTPTCPCSIVCQDEFGRDTTCGEFGEPCTIY